MNKSFEDTANRACKILLDAGGRCMWHTKVENTSFDLEGWLVGGRIVIMQFFHTGGCTHYLNSRGGTWSEFQADIQRLVTPPSVAPTADELEGHEK